MKKTKHSILNMLMRDAQPNGALGRICRASLDSFFDERKTKSGWVINESISGGKYRNWNERHAFKDNQATILAVAHCDTVWENAYPYDFDAKECRVYTPELDDRLGVYIITRLLPRLGVKCDVLLTENEEYCSSTAQDFTTQKQYNWIMEWDRRGGGVVLYQYETPELCEILQSFDFKIEQGTYSDICDLHWMKVAGINFATGYANEHTKSCFADLRCLAKQVAKFLRFYDAYKDIKIESKAGARYSGHWGTYHDDYLDYLDTRYVNDGYYDKEGKWHYYSTSATQLPLRSTYKPVEWKFRSCTCCGELSKARTSYQVRGKYICPTCEHKCKSCGYYYQTLQIDATTGLCKRCKAMMDALSAPPKVHRECNICKRVDGCTEVWTDAWVCFNCLYTYFVICDDCLTLLPADHACADNFAAVGICKICADSKDDASKRGWMSCEGCGKVVSVKDMNHFVDEGLHLCLNCSKIYLTGDEEEFKDDEVEYVVDRNGEVINADDTAIGYDYCDICGVRDELFEVEGLRICNICRKRNMVRGL